MILIRWVGVTTTTTTTTTTTSSSILAVPAAFFLMHCSFTDLVFPDFVVVMSTYFVVSQQTTDILTQIPSLFLERFLVPSRILYGVYTF